MTSNPVSSRIQRPLWSWIVKLLRLWMSHPWPWISKCHLEKENCCSSRVRGQIVPNITIDKNSSLNASDMILRTGFGHMAQWHSHNTATKRISTLQELVSTPLRAVKAHNSCFSGRGHDTSMSTFLPLVTCRYIYNDADRWVYVTMVKMKVQCLSSVSISPQSALIFHDKCRMIQSFRLSPSWCVFLFPFQITLQMNSPQNWFSRV